MADPKLKEAMAREFWIVKMFRNKTVTLTVHESKVEWKDIALGDERIHVIEKSAYDRLERKIEILKAGILNEVENNDCNCGFDDSVGEGYRGGTCFLHKAISEAEKV